MKWIPLLFISGLAFANGRPASSLSVTVEPPPGHRVLGSATFGLLMSSGAGWQWVCEPAIYAGGAFGNDDPRYLLSSTGTLYAALPSGLTLSRDGGCTWTRATGALGSANVADVAASPADSRTVYAVTSTFGAANGLYVSHDDGQSFALVGTGDSLAFFRRVVASGGDAWASGFDNVGGGQPHLLRYTGSLGTVTALQPNGLASAGAMIDLLGAAPGVLYLGSEVNSSVYKSTDGGDNWTMIYSTALLRAGWLDAAGALWLATGDGVVVSRDGGSSFAMLSPETLTCLGGEGGVLFGCTPASGRALERSTDGVTWSGILDFSHDVTGVLACPPGTSTRDVCEPLWPILMDQLGIPRPDGGGGGPQAQSGGGCGCEVASASEMPWMVIAVACCVLCARRRRT